MSPARPGSCRESRRGNATKDEPLTPRTNESRRVCKDLTFSGRTFIWAELIEEISHHPWLGTGFGAFWLGAEPGLPSAELLRRIGFFVLQGHNGFLDVLNETGVIGLIFLVTAFIVHAATGIRSLALNRPAAALHLTFFVCFLIGNFTEDNFRLFGPGFALFFFSSATLSRLRLGHDLQAAYPRPHEA